MVAKRAALWTAFGVSVKRVIVGVVINTVLTVLMAYPLSKSVREFPARRYYVWLLIFAMIFDGGLIPNYLQVKNLNLFDTIWALVLPGAVPIYNVILVMNFMKQLPDTIEEAAEVDGANTWQKIIHVTVPGLLSTFFVLLLLAISNMMSNGFEQFWLLGNGMTWDKLEVFDTYVYRMGIKNMEYSLATAMGIFKSIVSIILLTFANWASKKLRGDSIF